MNAAIVVHRGSLLGVVRKTYLPSYREFYGRRHSRRIQQASPKGAGQESGAKSFKWGVNDFGRIGYGGPCSPRRHGARSHRNDDPSAALLTPWTAIPGAAANLEGLQN